MAIQLCALVLANLISLQAAQGAAFDVASLRLVDLGHAYGEETLYWPSKPPAQFKLEQLSYGETPGGWFYAANRFCTAEHGGTHLDAPIHFARDGHTVDAVPLTQLVAPAVRIDVREQTARDRSYRLQVDDVKRFEQRWGTIRPGTIVLLQTGWSRFWPNRKEYFGSGVHRGRERSRFPELWRRRRAKLLVERAQLRCSASIPPRSTTAARRTSWCTASRPRPTSAGWKPRTSINCRNPAST